MKQKFTDEMVEEALDWFRTGSAKCGIATQERKRTENYAKEVKAAIFLHEEGTIKDREQKSECDPRVVAANKEMAKAAGREVLHKCESKRFEMIFDGWRTEQSSLRSLGALE
jgi:hypothetical protein